jgi:hypothetical protein
MKTLRVLLVVLAVGGPFAYPMVNGRQPTRMRFASAAVVKLAIGPNHQKKLAFRAARELKEAM